MSVWIKILIVWFAGGAGAVCRFLIERLLQTAESFTGLAVLVINSMSCLIIGVMAGWLVVSPWNYQHKTLATLLVMTGFCGGFSTFAEFSLDCVKYFEAGKLVTWILFALLTIVSGLSGCAFGYWLGQKL